MWLRTALVRCARDVEVVLAAALNSWLPRCKAREERFVGVPPCAAFFRMGLSIFQKACKIPQVFKDVHGSCHGGHQIFCELKFVATDALIRFPGSQGPRVPKISPRSGRRLLLGFADRLSFQKSCLVSLDPEGSG